MKTLPDERTPDRLIRMFSKSRIALGVAVALVLHIVLFSLGSINYLRDTFIDPEGAAERKKAAAAAANPEPTPTATPAPTASATPVPSPTAGAKTEEQLLKERSEAPVVKAITETAKPEEIPDLPKNDGMSLEDTNPTR